jgi:hypothetical protein
LDREGNGFRACALVDKGAGGGCCWSVGNCLLAALGSKVAACTNVALCVLTSGGSEEGGSEPNPGFNGVRNGDLNGLWSVFAASFSRRRFACGVDIFAGRVALAYFQWWYDSVCVEQRSEVCCRALGCHPVSYLPERRSRAIT